MNRLVVRLVIDYRFNMMANRHIQFLVAALFAISSVALSSELQDTGSEHHRHPGGDDRAVSDSGHSHGDSDDQHDTPGSPCHHHLMHCCCVHGLAFLGSGTSIPGRDGASSQFSLLTTSPYFEPCSSRVLHVPIV